MRTETVTRTLYNFAELSESAQQTAIEAYRAGFSDDTWWHEHVIDDFCDNVAPAFGWAIDKPTGRRTGKAVYFSGFWSQGDGAQFEGTWRAGDVNPDNLQEQCPQDAELYRLMRVVSACVGAFGPDATCRVVCEGRGCASHNTRFEFDTETEDNFEEERDKFVRATRELMDWLYRSLEQEYTYQTSEETIADLLAVAEYEFTEDGRMI